MALYRFHVQQISGFFEGCEFLHIPRLENQVADELSRLGSAKSAIPAGVALEHLRKPSIKPAPESDSIWIPKEPKPGVVPMDIDVGAEPAIPGTA